MTGTAGRDRSAAQVALAAILTGQLLVALVFAVTGAGKQIQTERMSIAVVGGTFAAGSLNSVVWPTLLAQRTGWSVSNFALPGAGFFADGRGGYAYTHQVDRAQQAHPRIILIATGQSDNSLTDMGLVTVGAVDAINKITLGGERALIVGPTWYEVPVPVAVSQVSDAVHTVAENAGVPFLDALDPPWLTRNLMQTDMSGPNDAGQSVIADKVAAWLRAEVER